MPTSGQRDAALPVDSVMSVFWTLSEDQQTFASKGKTDALTHSDMA